MSEPVLQTQNLCLVPQTREQIRAWINLMPPEEQAELSADWLALLDQSSSVDPWVHGFELVHKTFKRAIGKCGFKGPPGEDGAVEIAYGVESEHQGQGYATEAAAALVDFAFSHRPVLLVRAHTLPEPNASTRVLVKCGFRKVGEFVDPEDGLLWRWERINDSARNPTGP